MASSEEHRYRWLDMYGHRIWPLGETGYGVSVSYHQYNGGRGPAVPEFTLFHVTDDFRQALLTTQLKGHSIEPHRPTVGNVFDERIEEVLTWERLQWAGQLHETR